MFEAIGHSENARNLLKKYYIGDLVVAERPTVSPSLSPAPIAGVTSVQSSAIASTSVASPNQSMPSATDSKKISRKLSFLIGLIGGLIIVLTAIFLAFYYGDSTSQ